MVIAEWQDICIVIKYNKFMSYQLTLLLIYELLFVCIFDWNLEESKK